MNSSVTNFYAQKYFKDHGEKINSASKKNFSAGVKRNFGDESIKASDKKSLAALGAACLGLMEPKLNDAQLKGKLADQEKLIQAAEKIKKIAQSQNNPKLNAFISGVEAFAEKGEKPAKFYYHLGVARSMDLATGKESKLALLVKSLNEKKQAIADVSEGAEHVKNFARRNFGEYGRLSDQKKLVNAWKEEAINPEFKDQADALRVRGRKARREVINAYIKKHEKGLKGAFLLGMLGDSLKGDVDQDPANFEKFCNQCWDAFEAAKKSGQIAAQGARASLAWIDQFIRYVFSKTDIATAPRVTGIENLFKACFALGAQRATPKVQPDNSPYWPLDKDPMKCFMQTLCQIIFANAMVKDKALVQGINKFTNMTVNA